MRSTGILQMNKAYLLSLNTEANIAEQWDYGFLKSFIEGKMWKPTNWKPFTVQFCDKLPCTDRAIVVIPARHHKGLETLVDAQLKHIDRVVLFLMGDEEADFDIAKLSHENMSIWVQNPHVGKHDQYNKLGTGYPQHMTMYMPKEIHKQTDIFFAGQITHQRREELADILLNYELGDTTVKLVRTKGFTQGVPKEQYYEHMCDARIAPCPSGAVIPDSFRLFEALECMAIPVADEKLPSGEVQHYWDWLFGRTTPFPKATTWLALYDIVPNTLANYSELVQAQTAWYIKYKRDFAYKVLQELYV